MPPTTFTPVIEPEVSTEKLPGPLIAPLIAKVVEPMTEVDEAKMPLSAQMGVVVAAVVVAKLVSHENGLAPIVLEVR